MLNFNFYSYFYVLETSFIKVIIKKEIFKNRTMGKEKKAITRKHVLGIIGIFAGIFILSLIFSSLTKPDYDEDSDAIIKKLHSAIEKATEKGDYDCCIEPGCTMCYLGNWKFEQGTCFCDKAMGEGRSEDVCPECKKGLEEGRCKSAEGDFCEIKR